MAELNMIRKYFYSILIITSSIILFNCASQTKTINEKYIEELRVKYNKGKIETIRELISIFKNKTLPYEVRLKALKVLSETGHPDAEEAIKNFIARSSDIDYRLFNNAIEIIAKDASTENIETILNGINSANEKYIQSRTSTLNKLSTIPPEINIEIILKLYEVEKENYLKMQQSLSTLLGRIDDKKVIPILIDIAKDPELDFSTRSLAIEILSKKNHPEVTRAFIDMLHNPETQLKFRDFALTTLEEIPSYQMIYALADLYRNEKSKYLLLLEKLTESTKDVTDTTIVPVLKDIAISEIYPYKVRENAINSLTKFRDKYICLELIKLLEEPKNYILYKPIYKMAKEIGDKELLDKLRETELKTQKAIYQGKK
ncbi:MAG: HEAT repeat domain-containing protein [Candidatus Marinimicrobia bacterium]|nr:HEAT repeat domain-containing protein [Candidatus Neomarinimicrobiota bacterium]